LPDDGFRYALIAGELYRMPPTMGPHGLLVLAIGWYLYGFVKEHRLGLVYDQSGFILNRDPDTLLGPDLAFVAADRLPANRDGYPEVVPDLVEIASPSQTGAFLETNVRRYLSFGVRVVWVVDPESRTVQTYRADASQQVLTEDDVLDGEDVLPGFQLPISLIFE
jgi:Uma2 family endonuclease